MSKAVSMNLEILVQSFLQVRRVEWVGMPSGDSWSLQSCFRRFEKIHRFRFPHEDMRAGLSFLLAVFNIQMIIYPSVGHGADTTFAEPFSSEILTGIRGVFSGEPHVVRFLSIQDPIPYMIPLIPKLPSQFSFVSIEELESHLVIPLLQPQDIIPIEIASRDILLTTENILVLPQDIPLPLEELPDPILEISVPPDDRLIPVSEDPLIPIQEILLPTKEVLIPIPEETLVLAQGIHIPSEGVLTPIPILGTRQPVFGSSEDDWVIVTTSEIVDFVTCLIVRSNDFVFPEYILMFNSVVVPFVEPLLPREVWIPTPFEDSWEVVTLHRVDDMMIIIKVETLTFFSVYHFYCN